MGTVTLLLSFSCVNTDFSLWSLNLNVLIFSTTCKCPQLLLLIWTDFLPSPPSTVSLKVLSNLFFICSFPLCPKGSGGCRGLLVFKWSSVTELSDLLLLEVALLDWLLQTIWPELLVHNDSDPSKSHG